MNTVETLIDRLCPDGVEIKQLGKVCDLKNGFAFKSKLFRNRGFPIMRIANIQNDKVDENNFVYFDKADYSENLSQYKVSKGDILIAMSGATTGKIGYVDVDKTFYLNQRVGKFIPQLKALNNRFLFHYLLSKVNQLLLMSGVGSQPNLSSTKLMKITIPIPPLAVQAEIVRILDSFTKLEAELEAELEARKKQYEHYRNELLQFDGEGCNHHPLKELIHRLCPDGVEIKELGEVIHYSQPTKYIVKSTEYDDAHSTPVLTAGSSFILGHTNEIDGIYDANKDTPVIIFDDFTTSFHWVDFKFKVKSSAMKILTPKKGVVFRYAYHVMKSIRYKPSDHARQWISTYSNFKIPVPPLAVQEAVVASLDQFDALVHDISSGLPAEIAARRRQYEHYRNRLLTFQQSNLNYDKKNHNQ